MRGIKPEIWTDSKFVRLSPLARLLFIGLWNHACDNGHVEDDAVELKIRLLPLDNCDINALLDEIAATGQIERTDGWLKVPKLPVHQRIDLRYLTLCARCADDPETVFSDADKRVRTTGAQRAHDGHPKEKVRGR